MSLTSKECAALQLFSSFDFRMCHIDVQAWAFASLIYRKEDFITLVRSLFRSYTVRQWSSKHGSMAGAIVYDWDHDQAFFVARGTDGDDILGSIRSWLYDLQVAKNKDGGHSGFASVSRQMMRSLPVGRTPRNVYFTGTSMGAAVSVHNAFSYFKKNTQSANIRFISFSGPPPGDEHFAELVNNYLQDPKGDAHFSGRLYVMPQDPVSSKKLRRQNSVFLDGVDIGELVLLPDINLYDGNVLTGLINHSGRQWNACLGLWMNIPPDTTDDKGRLMSPFFMPSETDRALITLLGFLISN
jgi:hypothetical protein